MAGITDVLMNAFAMESATLARRRPRRKAPPTWPPCSLMRPWTRSSLRENRAGRVLGRRRAADQSGPVPRIAAYELVNSIALRRRIAGRLLQAGKYIV